MLDADTFLTIVYCLVDDVYKAEFARLKPKRRGHRPEMTDSEVLTLALLGQWQQDRSESAFVRYTCAHWQSYFPRLLSQSAFNRRVRDLSGVLCQLGPEVVKLAAGLVEHSPAYGALDSVPVPLMRRCRGDRHKLFAEEAAVGHGGTDREWYYGVQLLTEVDANGFITGFVVGPANTSARWLAEALFRWRDNLESGVPTAEELAPVLGPTHLKGGKRLGPTGPIFPRLGVGEPADHDYLGDLAFQGQAWITHWHDHYHATVQTKADCRWLETGRERQLARRWLASLRQIAETANNYLTSALGLTFPRPRTFWGLLTRLAAKVAAYDIAIYINYLTHRPTFSVFHPFP
jgi:hypothetical protein